MRVPSPQSRFNSGNIYNVYNVDFGKIEKKMFKAAEPCFRIYVIVRKHIVRTHGKLEKTNAPPPQTSLYTYVYIYSIYIYIYILGAAYTSYYNIVHAAFLAFKAQSYNNVRVRYD